MINRKELENGNIQFEDFAMSSQVPEVGRFYELPLCASGWTVGRFEVVAVRNAGTMIIAEAKRVR